MLIRFKFFVTTLEREESLNSVQASHRLLHRTSLVIQKRFTPLPVECHCLNSMESSDPVRTKLPWNGYEMKLDHKPTSQSATPIVTSSD